jgi:hypothetical protein
MSNTVFWVTGKTRLLGNEEDGFESRIDAAHQQET